MKRFVLALTMAYAAGYIVDAATGFLNPLRAGWNVSYWPVRVMGAVFGAVLGGVWGAVLAPAPLVAAPEFWIRLVTLVGSAGLGGGGLSALLLLSPPFLDAWAGGVVGAAGRRAVAMLAGRSPSRRR